MRTDAQGTHLLGLDVIDAHEVGVGLVRDVLVDSVSGTPAWLLIGDHTQPACAVPLARAWLRDDRIVLDVSAEDLISAPTLPLDTSVDLEAERRLEGYWIRRPRRDPGHGGQTGRS